MALAEGAREVVRQLPEKEGIVGDPRPQQLLEQGDLDVGEEHRELRRGEALAVGMALLELLVPRQELEDLEPEPGSAGSCRAAPGRHLVGHLREQPVALLLGHVAALDHPVQKDLDVDLVIGAVHAARVVDGVGVDAPAGTGELDAPELGEPRLPPSPTTRQRSSRRRPAPRRWRDRRRPRDAPWRP
jgi:hypothetical protein